MSGIFHVSSWVNTCAQWQQRGSTLGVIRLHAGQIRRGADGLRRHASQNASPAWGLPQYGQVHMDQRGGGSARDSSAWAMAIACSRLVFIPRRWNFATNGFCGSLMLMCVNSAPVDVLTFWSWVR